MPDLIGTITASRRTYEAAVSIRGAIVAVGDKQMIDGLRADLDARFKELATAMGYLVTRDEQDRSAAE